MTSLAASGHPLPTRDVEVLGYHARVAAGIVGRTGIEVRAVAPARTYVVITDENVAPHWLAAVESSFRSLEPAPRLLSHTIPAGEESKTRDMWTRVTDWMLASECGRDTTVVALGGGVVGDLAGFVASTYMRGVPVVQVPTSLLAMVDAAIGGKTGVDTPLGKNLVGAFHQPAAVLVDPTVLATLPPRHVRAGMAEVLKHGAIRSRELFDDAARFAATANAGLVSGRGVSWEHDEARDLIVHSIAVKADIVRLDEREAGRRAILNTGHTVAHALEVVSGYRLLHGEAVAIGLAVEATFAEFAGTATRGTSERIREALAAAGLPTRLPADLPARSLLDAMHTDKKVRSGRLAFSLLAEVGLAAGSDEHGWTSHFDRERVLAWMEGLAES